MALVTPGPVTWVLVAAALFSLFLLLRKGRG